MNIRSIDFEAAATEFAKENGMEKASPIVRAAIRRGAELAVAALTKDVAEVVEDLIAEHHKMPPPHGDKSGTLQVIPNGI